MVFKKHIFSASGTGDRGFESRRFDQTIRLSLKGSLIFDFRDSNLKVLRRLNFIVIIRRSASLRSFNSLKSSGAS